MPNENLTKIHIDLPHHWAIGGESYWAESLGDDCYRLCNVPFFAYDLNFHDVVRATPNAPDVIPEIREVVERSGHKTLRVLFEEAIERSRQETLLDQLHVFEATYERADGTHVSIDIQADGSYTGVYDQLQAWEDDELLVFETCEARSPGSFDDLPESSADV